MNQTALAQQCAGDVFKYGKLDRGYHAPLVNELDRFSREAGIHPRYVSGADYALTAFEIDYLKGFRFAAANGGAGLLYVGSHEPPVQERCMSICGALLRNYISARFMLRDELVHELWDRKRYPKFDLMAVPDLAVEGLAEAPKRALAAWLVRRMSRGEQTAVGVPNHKVLKDLLGPDSAYMVTHFKVHKGVMNTA